MKNAQRFLLPLFLCCFSTSAHAAWVEPWWLNEAPYTQTKSEVQKIEETRQSVKMLIGNVSIALLEADHSMSNAALDRLGNVRQNIKDLESSKTPLKPIKAIQAGRLDYKLPPHNGQRFARQHYALFPFEESSFTVPIPELNKAGEKHGEIVIKDAQVLVLQVDLDMDAIKSNLENAVQALAHDDPVMGASQLQYILDRDITLKEESNPDMLLAVYQEVIFAERLFMAEHYAFTRFTLYHARSDLREYAAEGKGISQDAIRTLSDDIQTATEDLKKEAPGRAEQIREKMRHWRVTIKQWLKDQAEAENKTAQ